MKQGKQGQHLGKNKLFLDFKINPAFMASSRTADQERVRTSCVDLSLKETSYLLTCFNDTDYSLNQSEQRLA